MAAPDARNVAAAKPFAGGGIYWAPADTPLPVDAITALDAAFKPLGYVSNDGIQPSRETNIEKKTAWGGDVVAALLADESRSFEFTLWEVFYDEVQKFVHGAENVVVTAATPTSGTQTSIVDKGGKRPNVVLVFDIVHAAKRRRLVVGNADYNVTGELPFVDNDLSGYTVTVEAIKDSTGARVHEYLVQDNKLATP